jgi:hypothetical protein
MTAINSITFSFFMIFSFEIEIVNVDGWNRPHEKVECVVPISKCGERGLVEERLFRCAKRQVRLLPWVQKVEMKN